jgi:antitoxin component YwqK of YwqJK toxin-antitoxin module
MFEDSDDLIQPVTNFSQNGVKESEGTLKNGLKHGIWTEFFSDGKPATRAEYHDGKEQGLCTRWYPSGQKEIESTLVDGVAEGPWIRWYTNGQKQAEGRYHGFTVHPRGDLIPKPDGRYLEWHSNGKQAVEGEYRNGEKNGRWISRNEEGVVITIEHWVDGRKLEVDR